MRKKNESVTFLILIELVRLNLEKNRALEENEESERNIEISHKTIGTQETRMGDGIVEERKRHSKMFKFRFELTKTFNQTHETRFNGGSNKSLSVLLPHFNYAYTFLKQINMRVEHVECKTKSSK